MTPMMTSTAKAVLLTRNSGSSKEPTVCGVSTYAAA
jgi:hypothetical protein